MLTHDVCIGDAHPFVASLCERCQRVAEGAEDQHIHCAFAVQQVGVRFLSVFLSLFVRVCRYNTKCDGRIDQQEFRLLCEDLGYNLSPTQCRLAVKLLDLKGVGGVGFEDFRKWWGTEDRFNRFRRIQVQHSLSSKL